MGPVAAGWYADMQGVYRWWDGTQWTDDVLPPPAAGHPPLTEREAANLDLQRSLGSLRESFRFWIRFRLVLLAVLLGIFITISIFGSIAVLVVSSGF